jgi:hypothetical protein
VRKQTCGPTVTASPAALLPFSNDPQPSKRTLAVGGLRARLTYYDRDHVEVFKRVDSGCWLGQAYRSVDLEVGGIVYLVAALQIKGHGGMLSNSRYSSARYSEDKTLIDYLPLGSYDLKVELSADDYGEFAATYYFELDVGQRLAIRRVTPFSRGTAKKDAEL